MCACQCYITIPVLCLSSHGGRYPVITSRQRKHSRQSPVAVVKEVRARRTISTTTESNQLSTTKCACAHPNDRSTRRPNSPLQANHHAPQRHRYPLETRDKPR